MKTVQGRALIKEKEHNGKQYKIETVKYDISPDDRFCEVICEVSVKMKFLWFWITIWRENITYTSFDNIDDYNDEVQYNIIKAEDIIIALTF